MYRNRRSLPDALAVGHLPDHFGKHRGRNCIRYPQWLGRCGRGKRQENCLLYDSKCIQSWFHHEFE